jgi:hypothetical protein
MAFKTSASPYQSLCEHDDDIVAAILVDREWLVHEVDYRLWQDDAVEMDHVEVFWHNLELRPFLHAELAGRVLTHLTERSSEWADYIQTAEETIYVTASRHLRIAITDMLDDEQTRLEIYAKVKARQVEAEQARTPEPEFPITILNARTGLIAEPMEVVVCRT